MVGLELSSMMVFQVLGWPGPWRTDVHNRADFCRRNLGEVPSGALSVNKNAQAVARNGCRLAGHGLVQALALKSGGQVAVAAGKKA